MTKIIRRTSRLLILLPFIFLALNGVSAEPPKSSLRKKAAVRKKVRKSAGKKAYQKYAAHKKKRVIRKARKNARRRRARRKRATSPTTAAKITSVRRHVEIQSASGNQWRKARSNTQLDASDKIRTGRNSLARIKLEDGSKVLLLQNSKAAMENLSSVQRTINLLRGKVRAIVRRLKGARSFKIKTPIGVASVRGTDFEVEFNEDDQEMMVNVARGSVAVAKLGDLADEVLLKPGERIKFTLEEEIGDPIRSGAIPLNRMDVRSEVMIAQVKNSVVAQAAEESRNADYQVGKSLIDVDGSRVRVEEYIMRPASNQFKLVSLNERSSRFDYFTYTGTFNQDLPADLSLALSEVGGKLGSTAPDYYLTAYEMFMSNTNDYIKDSGAGGHLVRIDYDGTNYTLTDNADATNTKTVEAATLQADGSYKIYNPIKDTFSLTTAANLSEAQKIAVLDSGSYRNFGSGDVFWKTRFNTNTYYINSTLKSSFSPKSGITNTLALDLDASFSNAPITTISEFPSGTGSLHNRLTLFYSDGTKTEFDNYIIDDEGNIAESSRFSGLSTSAAYQNELNNWNYQQKIKADELNDSINLVIDPRIGTMSGLIQ